MSHTSHTRVFLARLVLTLDAATQADNRGMNTRVWLVCRELSEQVVGRREVLMQLKASVEYYEDGKTA